MTLYVRPLMQINALAIGTLLPIGVSMYLDDR